MDNYRKSTADDSILEEPADNELDSSRRQHLHMHQTQREGNFMKTQWGRNALPTNKSCEDVSIPGTLTPSKYAFKRFMQRKQEGA